MSNSVFSCKYISSLTVSISTSYFAINKANDAEGTGNILCDLDPNVKCLVMYFHVNASPPTALNVASSNFAGA